MKTLGKVLAVIALLFTASVLTANAQSMESQWRNFFSSSNNLPYRTICRLAHPSNTFDSGSLYMEGNKIIVTIYSHDSDGRYTLKVRLHATDGYFDSIVKISDNDFPPAWWASDIMKVVLNELFTNVSIDLIARLEEFYGQRLRDMDAKEMTLAALTILLFKYPG